MSLHKDLLDQAVHLARREPKRPRQASLRRAVSAAYYAVFHMLIDAASKFLIRGNNRSGLRLAVTRAFDHGEMKAAANTFKGGTLGRALGTPAIPKELKQVCETFVDLQQARHEADYDLSKTFGRYEVLDLVGRAKQAFEQWAMVANNPAGDAFLVALLLHRKLDRR